MLVNISNTTIYEAKVNLSSSGIEVIEGHMDVDIDMFARPEHEKVWEMAGNVFKAPKNGGMNLAELDECFGTDSISYILDMPVYEALDKYESWKEKNSVKNLKPQDVIAVPDIHNKEKKYVFMVTAIDTPLAETGYWHIVGIRKDGDVTQFSRKACDYKGLEKIGRVVETTDILGEIKKIEDEWRKNN